MPFQKSVAAALAALALGAGVFAFQNCSHSSGSGSGSSSGPIDGTYQLSAYQCGNRSVLSYYASLGVTTTTIAISNTGANETLTLSSGCQVSEALTLAYVDSSHLTSTQGAITCGSTCGNQCIASAAPTSQTPDVMTYSVSGSVLSLSGTVQTTDLQTNSDLSNTGCHVGDALLMTFNHL